MILGIDATNLRQGGGRTHLIELLNAAKPSDYGFAKVVVWGAHSTLRLLKDADWLIKRSPQAQEGGLVRRSIWQRFELASEAQIEGCHLLFVPGGSFSTSFRPIVTMSRNMLPFEWSEMKRFGFTFLTLKQVMLRWSQSRSFRLADGVIFLTHYAQKEVLQTVGFLNGKCTIIPHGLNSRFLRTPKVQMPIDIYNKTRPFRVLYVSIIDMYKHQWYVVEAIGKLRRKHGWPLVLDLIGPAYQPAMALFQKALRIWDPQEEWVKYHGALPYSELHQIYQSVDLGLFASSCENMPNILLETMAAGLPIASSDRGPMPEILGDAGLYFNPEKPDEIVQTLELLILSTNLRTELASRSYTASELFTWDKCANETFRFLANVNGSVVV